MTLRRFIAPACAAIVVAVGVVGITNAAAPSVVPSDAVRFPDGFTAPIYVGENQVWPTTPSSTTTEPPTTSTTTPPTTGIPSTTGAPTSTAEPATSTSSTVATGPTTTMAPMTMMPVVTSFAAAATDGFTTPRLIGQQYPYQVSDGTAAFRITAHYSNFGYADPIVFPGGASPHLHVFFGNTCVTATMTDPTTCGRSTNDGGTLNKTGYWQPAIIAANGAAVMPDVMQVYYKSGYKGVDPHTVKTLPAGLRMVAGTATRTTADLGAHDYDRTVNYGCNNGDTNFNHIPTHAEGQANGCTPGSWFVVSVEFPQCWDGVHLDSPNHKSHMAQATGGGCPADHPVALPEITERALYITPSGGIPDGWRLSSDNYAYNGRNAGYSGHADWMNGWDQPTFAKVVAGCYGSPFGPVRDCSMDLLGNGEQLGY